MEQQARSMSDAELTEIAWRNDFPPALKARAELARRAAEHDRKVLRWTKAAAIAAGLGVAVGLLVWIFPGFWKAFT